MTTVTPTTSAVLTSSTATACDQVPSEASSMSLDSAVQVATVLKALAEPLRLRMLSLITSSPTGEACVCDIATVADVAQPTVSHHLKVLKDVGVLTSERRGTWVYYRVAPALRGAVGALLDAFAPATLEAAGRASAAAGLDDVDHVLTRVAERLAETFPGLTLETVTTTVRESYTALARTAGVRAHLVVRAERFARQRLQDISSAGDTTTAPQVLFVCVANAGRSQLAAELVRRYAGDRVVVRSAGSAPAGDVHPEVRTVLADLGATPGEAFPKPITDDAVRAAHVVVTMGCGDTCPILPDTRYDDWVVGDPALASHDGVLAITQQIDAHVRELLTSLLPDLELPAAR